MRHENDNNNNNNNVQYKVKLKKKNEKAIWFGKHQRLQMRIKMHNRKAKK